MNISMLFNPRIWKTIFIDAILVLVTIESLKAIGIMYSRLPLEFYAMFIVIHIAFELILAKRLGV